MYDRIRTATLFYIHCHQTLVGRYVILHAAATSTKLTLCEVKVYEEQGEVKIRKIDLGEKSLGVNPHSNVFCFLRIYKFLLPFVFYGPLKNSYCLILTKTADSTVTDIWGL